MDEKEVMAFYEAALDQVDLPVLMERIRRNREVYGDVFILFEAGDAKPN
jgi:hypothetical protein